MEVNIPNEGNMPVKVQCFRVQCFHSSADRQKIQSSMFKVLPIGKRFKVQCFHSFANRQKIQSRMFSKFYQ